MITKNSPFLLLSCGHLATLLFYIWTWGLNPNSFILYTYLPSFPDSSHLQINCCWWWLCVYSVIYILVNGVEQINAPRTVSPLYWGPLQWESHMTEILRKANTHKAGFGRMPQGLLPFLEVSMALMKKEA